MGLFGSKKKTVVGTGVARLIEDKYLPNAMRFGMLKGIFAGDGQMSNYMLEEMLNGIALKAEQMYRYGESKYVNGLPSMTVIGQRSGQGVVQGLLEQEVGKPITFEYFSYGALNSLHYAWAMLQQNYGYNKSNNEIKTLSTLKGFPVYLDDIIIVVPAAEYADAPAISYEQWGDPANVGQTPTRRVVFNSPLFKHFSSGRHTPIQISNVAAEEYALIKYTWVEVITETVNDRPVTRRSIKNEELILPIIQGEENTNYVHALYYFDSDIEAGATTDQFGNSQPLYAPIYKYFFYQEKEGSYPEIDAIYDPSYQGFGSFFPRAYFRDDSASLTDNPTSAEYKSTKKLLKYLNIDYQELAESLKENPDVAGIWQSLLMMAVPGNSTNEIEAQYLFDFFNKAYAEFGLAGITGDSFDLLAMLKSGFGIGSGVGSHFSLVIQDARLKMAINIDKASKSKKVGKIGPVGFCDNRKSMETIMVDRLDDYGAVVKEYQTLPYYYYRKQISDTIYEEIVLVNITTVYNVHKKYYTSSGDEDSGNIFMIPLDYSITQHYKNRDRELLYSRSLHLVFNAVEKVKVKWYQSDFFQFLLMLVVVIYIAFTWDAGSGMQLLAAAGNFANAALLIAQMVIVSYVETMIIKWVVDAIGLDAAIILAAVLFAYGSFSKYFASSGVQGAPWADSLMKISSGLIKASQDFLTEKMLGLKDEAEAFGYDVTEKNKLLEEANDLLWSENIFTPFILAGEDPDAYYRRTVHAGNIGMYSINAVSDYVSTALTLPTFSETSLV